MEIKQLDQNQVRLLYDTKMKVDFPPSELRPYSSIAGLTQEGKYICFGYMDEQNVAAYAAFAYCRDAALLDYYAVDQNLRGKGVGGEFLKGIREMSGRFNVPAILIEVESVESAETPQEIEERKRRIHFYLKCGCRETRVYSYLFGVEYQMLYLPLEDLNLSDSQVRDSLEKIYRLIVPPLVDNDQEAFNKVCRCFIREN